jgi:rare lipoprotein A
MHARNLLILFIFYCLVASCSAVHRADYIPPPGKTYAVASWYGPKFHGRPTSSGEIFDMYKNTCAHKKYPFGLRLRVTNLSNNRSVECVVNDRGPFIKGRDIDLSYASAKTIGLIGPGVGRVLLETVSRDEQYVKKVKIRALDRTGPFAIQIASFKKNINAVRLKKVLSFSYGNVYIQEALINGQTYYRVRIGDFYKFDNALAIARQLGQVGYQPMVIRSDPRI